MGPEPSPRVNLGEQRNVPFPCFFHQTLGDQFIHCPADGDPADPVLLGQLSLCGQPSRLAKQAAFNIMPELPYDLRIERYNAVMI